MHLGVKAVAFEVIEIGVEPERRVIGEKGLLIIARGKTRASPRLMGGGKVGLQNERVFIGGEGFSVPSQPDERVAAVVMPPGVCRVQGGCAVVIRQGAVEPPHS